MATPIDLRKTYQLKITLLGSEPSIWRQILVPSNIELIVLHDVIQVTMGWFDSHLHMFIKDKILFVDEPDEYFNAEAHDELDYTLHQLLKKTNDAIVYEYDFGDGWQHKIQLEKILPYDPKKKLPTCLDGARACPLEDSGGIASYQHILEVINQPNHPEYEDIIEWYADELTSLKPDIFNKDSVNKTFHPT